MAQDLPVLLSNAVQGVSVCYGHRDVALEMVLLLFIINYASFLTELTKAVRRMPQ